MSDENLAATADDAVPVLQSAGEPDLPPPPRSHRRYWLLLTLGLAAYVSLFFLGGWWWRFALAGLQSIPFLILAILAYVADHKPHWRPASFAYWSALMSVVAGIVLLLSTAAVMRPEAIRAMIQSSPGSRYDGPLFVPGGTLKIVQIAVAFVGIGILSLCFYLGNVRRSVAGLLPTYSGSFVHAVAVATVFTITAVLVFPLIILGEPPVLRLFQGIDGTESIGGMSRKEQIFDTLAGLIWLVPCAILAVGYPFARTIRESLERIGLVRPTRGQVLFAVLAALALVGVMHSVDHGIQWLWTVMGWPVTDSKAFEQLMEFALNPLGAAVIGVTAGLGEELFARGVLQPRIGILLSNLLFTAAHALQYNWDALTSVFLIGLVLGVIRQKSNTTTSAIVHGTYDFTLLLGTYYGFF
jgi:membrane protease YdiL (CAAX protease family)